MKRAEGAVGRSPTRRMGAEGAEGEKLLLTPVRAGLTVKLFVLLQVS
jgi:hypothetical protein